MREVSEALEFVKMMGERKGILTTMNKCIIDNHQQGIYNGCKNAVELAHQLAGYAPEVAETLNPKF